MPKMSEQTPTLEYEPRKPARRSGWGLWLVIGFGVAIVLAMIADMAINFYIIRVL